MFSFISNELTLNRKRDKNKRIQWNSVNTNAKENIIFQENN